MYKYVSTKMIFGIGLAIRNQQQTTASVAKKFFLLHTMQNSKKKIENGYLYKTLHAKILMESNGISLT